MHDYERFYRDVVRASRERALPDDPKARRAGAIGEVAGRVPVEARDEGVVAGPWRPVGEAVVNLSVERQPPLPDDGAIAPHDYRDGKTSV